MATTSAETSGKGKEKAMKNQMVPSLKSKQQQRYESEHGWEDELHSSFKFTCELLLPPNYSSEIASRAKKFKKDLDDSKGFLQVDSESRSFDVAGFYRVYPYYDWDPDPTQIQDQKAILKRCCDVAVRRHNQRTDDHLIFHKLVSANMLTDGFPIYFITLKAYKKQLSREYMTRVQYIRYHRVTDIAQAIINIHCFRPTIPPYHTPSSLPAPPQQKAASFRTIPSRWNIQHC